MGNEIHDGLDALPAAPRNDFPDADLMLVEGSKCRGSTPDMQPPYRV